MRRELDAVRGLRYDRDMFEGLDNFRDFGGVATQDGRRVRTGRLFRSAHHGFLTDADMKALEGLGLAAIVDLRETKERERSPSRRLPADVCLLIDNNINEDRDSWLDYVRNHPDLTPTQFREWMIKYYGEVPFDDRHVDLFRRYFEVLAEDRGGVLIHCVAGKDRTGILAAITLALLGVSDDDILKDYLLTNTAADLEGRAPMVAKYVGEQIGREIDPKTILAGLLVSEAHMRQAWNAISGRHGEVDEYLRATLRMSDAQIRAIRDSLLHDRS